MITVAFTGTQIGCTTDQLDALEQWLMREKVVCLHMGDCIGADKEAASIARRLGLRVTSHPPVNSRKRAYFRADDTRKALPYLDRNRAMVDECRRLVACPKDYDEVLRSGTWATIRYATKQCYRVDIIWPNGTIDVRNVITQRVAI